MAITISGAIIDEFASDYRSVSMDILSSNSYPTGGETYEAEVLAKNGWTVIQSAIPVSNDTVYECIIDNVAKKIKMVLRSTYFEVTAGTDLSAVKCTLLVTGY